MRFDLVARLYREIEAGRMEAGMLTVLIASGLAPRLLTLVPRVFAETLLAVFFVGMTARELQVLYPCAIWCRAFVTTSMWSAACRVDLRRSGR